MRRATLIALGAAAVLAGCGDPRGEAASVAGEWFDAVAKGDGAAACELMLPTARLALQDKYVQEPGLECPELVRAYRDVLPDAVVEQIQEVGFVPDGTIRRDRLGVFPESGPHELSVVLMERDDDRWKVAGVAIGPEPGVRR